LSADFPSQSPNFPSLRVSVLAQSANFRARSANVTVNALARVPSNVFINDMILPRATSEAIVERRREQMLEPEKTNDDAAANDATENEVGDVESAGETTAADTISGPTETKPVGADTMVKVADEPDSSNDDEPA
jgi:hypothetical protein